MKKLKWLAAAAPLLAGLAGGGCAGALPKMMDALNKDQAVVLGRVNTIYGTMSLTRIGGTTNSVTVAPDGTVSVNK